MLEMHGRSWELDQRMPVLHSSSANTAADFLLMFYVQPCALLVVAAVPVCFFARYSGVWSCVQ